MVKGSDFPVVPLYCTTPVGVVGHISDKIGVMYLGRLVEVAATDDLFQRQLHPYTRALISAVPKLGRRESQGIILQGSVPTPIDPPSGCVFYTRSVAIIQRAPKGASWKLRSCGRWRWAI